MDTGYCIDIDMGYYIAMGYGYEIWRTGINPIWNAKPNGFSKLQIGEGEGGGDNETK